MDLADNVPLGRYLHRVSCACQSVCSIYPDPATLVRPVQDQGEQCLYCIRYVLRTLWLRYPLNPHIILPASVLVVLNKQSHLH